MNTGQLYLMKDFGEWICTNDNQEVTVRIKQIGPYISAMKTNDSDFIPKNEVLFMHHTEQKETTICLAQEGFSNPRWVEAEITVVNQETIALDFAGIRREFRWYGI